jgi:hypothetical protein
MGDAQISFLVFLYNKAIHNNVHYVHVHVHVHCISIFHFFLVFPVFFVPLRSFFFALLCFA